MDGSTSGTTDERPAETTDDAIERVESRLAAVERALTGGEAPEGGVGVLEDAAALEGRVTDVEDRLTAIEDRLDDLDAATQAIRGYVGAVRAVNRDVERRVNLALAAVEDLRPDPVDETLTEAAERAREGPASNGGQNGERDDTDDRSAGEALLARLRERR